ncbi:MAG: precorrin-6y C5,15-methyltransferase (decarboxylating) subunit CbiE [Prevotella sp.]|jgi:precorrin-6Y C5,15-methyltransferase (decarboxylating)|nr:precorrin-6y C5,15-methyltransferase (decarboxylating) subunit CbiE [Prevotella sp.]
MRFFVIGIDDNKEQHFNPEITNVISLHTVFSGGVRHREIVKDLLPVNYRWIDIKAPLPTVFEKYKPYEEIVVFASGDPLFFGFANTIQRMMPDAEIVLYPYFNSLQLLAHRLLMPYQDMHIVSLTGRPWHKFDEALIMGFDKIGILTDNKEHTPHAIADRMLYYGYDNYMMSVGELLGNKEQEKYNTYRPEDVKKQNFAFPNNIILQKTEPRPRPFGIPECDFNLLDGRVKMITKMPVRLLSLSLLDLRDKSVFWDVGFCTGSVSVEAKMQFPHLHILAFEKREKGAELIDSNMRKFGTPGISFFTGDFLTMNTDSLPCPDAVFVGGHGGKMKEIVTKIKSVSNSKAAIVFNAVSGESRQMFIDALLENNLVLMQDIEIKIDDFNTIHVMKGGDNI